MKSKRLARSNGNRGIKMDIDWDCPVCGMDYLRRCRCPRSDSACANGHEWHYCLAHDEPRIVVGKSDHSIDIMTCICGNEE